ncbi:MAG: hypothetical protein CTY16_08415 [Methylobacter sp.]|nr:MAG: hypothetical protein CTY16_08415 [Methylobacter sp.]
MSGHTQKLDFYRWLFFLLLAVPGFSSANDFTECWYFPSTGNDEAHENQCLLFLGGGGLQDEALINKKVAIGLAYDADGLAYVRTQDSFLYVTSDGYARKTLSYDNGPDVFAEGLARIRKNGKIGYIDKSLKIVIPPLYDFGFPFDGGYAIVCKGCVEQPDGEHKMWVGGLWGAVDPLGNIKYDLKYSAEEIRPLVKDGPQR